jgi:hypothetical protein
VSRKTWSVQYCIPYGITKYAGGTVAKKEARFGVWVYAGKKVESGRSARYCVPYGIVECAAIMRNRTQVGESSIASRTGL